ncbi:class I SAM-dependent methyltransferase [Orrella sp. 11846]|uniref:class I SAM-dependent methyltransferase n=1 Tax=Orrella sp. 11846 TaxID=3409913 RepID=UPI003B5901E6
MYRDLIDDLDGFQIEPAVMLDVPFVPTDDAVIKAILKLGEIHRDDVIYDLGAGDGRILIEAARRFLAQGVGIELDPLRIADGMEDAAHARVEHMVDFIEESFFDADISPATVVILYLLESVNLELRPHLLKTLKPGTRVLSHAFDMGDWEPDEHLEMGCVNLYKWVIPAQIAGQWAWECVDDRLFEIELTQTFQKVQGQAWCEGKPVELNGLALVGNTLELQVRPSVDSDSAITQNHQFTLYFESGELVSVEQSE